MIFRLIPSHRLNRSRAVLFLGAYIKSSDKTALGVVDKRCATVLSFLYGLSVIATVKFDCTEDRKRVFREPSGPEGAELHGSAKIDLNRSIHDRGVGGRNIDRNRRQRDFSGFWIYNICLAGAAHFFRMHLELLAR